MLGTTLGAVNGKEYSAVDKTAFGVSNSGTNTFFTGKPYVADLGYAFLFRNYRADVGKWQTQDPLGYPDGWNNFAYCGNDVISAIDPNGLWTISFSINLFGGSGGGIIGSVGIAFGYSAESGFTCGTTASGGGGGIIGGAASASISVSVTSEPNVGALEGISAMTGGSFGAGISIGGDIIFTREEIEGISASVGLTALPEAECHTMITNTVVHKIGSKGITISSISE